MRYYFFIINVYDKSVGSDSFSEQGWLVEVDGSRKTGCQLYILEDRIQSGKIMGILLMN